LNYHLKAGSIYYNVSVLHRELGLIL
jgi:hypothetical protein